MYQKYAGACIIATNEIDHMCPRKSRHRVPEWAVKLFKNDRKKLLFGPYDCPKCGTSTLRIEVDKKRKEVVAVCNCGLGYPLDYVPSLESIDYYNKLVDQFYKK